MIKLFVKEGCLYCRKVISKINELNLEEGIDYGLTDAAPGTHGRTVVLERGGKPQVPFMIDEDVYMYESGEIIKYIKAKFAE